MNISASPLPPNKPEVALIAGPTASGKSALALALAESCNGVVINADSAQVYRDLRIVTARPRPEEEARAPHLLYGYRDAAETCSAADWAQDAKAAIAQAHAARKLPVVVGGTGLYIRSLLEGIAPVPGIDSAVRAKVRALPVEAAHAALTREDPEAAARLQASDAIRVARALEVVRSTGRPLKDWQKERTRGIADTVALAPLILLPPREWLYARCNVRFEKMVSDDGITEVSSLLKQRLPALAPIMRSIGVREIGAFLSGALSREQALEAGKAATRQYAKRQYTWFSRQPPAHWPRFEEALEGRSIEAALELLRHSLSS